MSEIILYRVLGLKQNCSPTEVLEAHNKLVSIWREKLKDDKVKLSLWLKLADKALDVLSDPIKKNQYDMELKIRLSANSSSKNIQTIETNFNKELKTVQSANTITIKKQGILSKVLSWIWDTVWGVLGPILKLSIRIGVLGAAFWLVFLAPFTENYRAQIKVMASSAWSEYGPAPKKTVSAYNSLRCEKVRMRVAEAEKIKERYEKKLKAKEIFIVGAALGSLLKGDKKTAAGIAGAGSVLSNKESNELEKADAFLKGKIIDDLECFRKNQLK
jgi:curved DNA-binding protein CbpA